MSIRQQLRAMAHRPLPVLTFPGAKLVGVTVRDMATDSDAQARAICAAVTALDMPAALGCMDLSVEAEAFGAQVVFTDWAVPTITGQLIATPEEAEALPVPPVGAGRTGLYLAAIRRLMELLPDRPVLAGGIGPFSLAGRLRGVSALLVDCRRQPALVRTLLEKATAFQIAYLTAYRALGVAGVVLADPMAGHLSPAMAEKFALPYVRRVLEAVQREDFAVIYHNCGDSAAAMAPAIAALGADACHFGDSADLAAVLEAVPADCLVMGNLSPTRELLHGTPESVAAATDGLLALRRQHPNLWLSTGCDVPAEAPWENIRAFFSAAERGAEA